MALSILFKRMPVVLGLILSLYAPFASGKCEAPYNFKFETISTTQVKISWDGSMNDQSYDVRRREMGTNEWTTVFVEAPTTNRRFTGLKPGTTYEWEVQAYGKNKNGGSGFVPAGKFVTFSNCALPTDFAVQSSGLTSATLGWAYNTNMLKYEVRVKPADDEDAAWKNYFTEYSSLTVSGLLPYTAYEWQIRSFCADNSGSGSAFSASEYFSTQSYLQKGLSRISIESKNANSKLTSSSNIKPANNYVKMINTMGQTVKQYPISYTDAVGGVYFDMNAPMPSGVYYIQLPAELNAAGQTMLVK